MEPQQAIHEQCPPIPRLVLESTQPLIKRNINATMTPFQKECLRQAAQHLLMFQRFVRVCPTNDASRTYLSSRMFAAKRGIDLANTPRALTAIRDHLNDKQAKLQRISGSFGEAKSYTPLVKQARRTILDYLSSSTTSASTTD